VRYILSCGTDSADNEETIQLAKKFPSIRPAIGFHPHSADQFSEGDLIKIEEILKKEKVYAIGEIGLDFYRFYSRRENQLEVFRTLVALAQRYNLPMSIHSREAHQKTIDILKEVGYFNGVFHCFSGDWGIAKTILNLGFYLGFSGSLTYNSDKLADVIKRMPQDRILIETDAPYLAPVPLRGKTNEPAYLVYIVQRIAEIRGESKDKVAEITTENGKRLFLL